MNIIFSIRWISEAESERESEQHIAKAFSYCGLYIAAERWYHKKVFKGTEKKERALEGYMLIKMSV